MSEHDTGCRCHHCVTAAAMKMSNPTQSSFAAPTGLAARLNRERLTKIENRLGWGGSDKWPVTQSISLWAVAAETVLDERDALKARLETLRSLVAPAGSALPQLPDYGHLMDYVLDLHIITGPNGMCRCGEDGITCSERLRCVSHEIGSALLGAHMAKDKGSKKCTPSS